MATITEQLAALKERRDELDRTRAEKAAAIATAAEQLDSDRVKLDELSEQQRKVEADVDATSKLETDVGGAAKALEECRGLATADLATARTQHTALTNRINQELSAKRRAALAKEIDKIDDAIKKAGTTARAAADKLAAAEEAVAEARLKVAGKAEAHEEALQRLQALPQRTDAARARVNALRASTTTAVDTGRMAEGFVRARDLKTAMDDLDAALSDTEDAELANDLPDLWSEALKASGELTTATAALGPLQDEASAARVERDKLLAGRDESIALVLSRPPEPGVPEEPEGGPSAPPDGPGPQ